MNSPRVEVSSEAGFITDSTRGSVTELGLESFGIMHDSPSGNKSDSPSVLDFSGNMRDSPAEMGFSGNTPSSPSELGFSGNMRDSLSKQDFSGNKRDSPSEMGFSGNTPGSRWEGLGGTSVAVAPMCDEGSPEWKTRTMPRSHTVVTMAVSTTSKVAVQAFSRRHAQ